MRDDLLTAREAAAAMKLSLAAFYAWRRRHHIPNAIESRALRFYRSDLVRPSRGPRLVEAEQAFTRPGKVVPSRDWVEAGRRA